MKIIIGIIIGLIAYHFLFKPEIKTEIVETVRTETDTIYQVVRDTVTVTQERIIHEYLRDTIINSVPLNLSRFKGMEPLTYGNIHYSGLVAGEVLKIGFTTDFKIPQVTNTIFRDRTVTKTVIPGGSLYVGTGLSQGMNLVPMAAYQIKGWQVGGSYQLSNREISVNVMKKVF